MYLYAITIAIFLIYAVLVIYFAGFPAGYLLLLIGATWQNAKHRTKPEAEHLRQLTGSGQLSLT